MASSMPTLDQTPPVPPELSGQMGQSPYAGVSSMMKDQAQQQGGGGAQAHPQGALIAQSEAVKKVIDQMAKMEPGFGPFADRIKSILDAGLGVVVSGGPPGQSAAEKPSIMGPNSMKATPPGSGFPG